MPTVTTDLERRLYDALKRISKYQSSERLLRKSWDDWGVENGTEALEMAYENIQQEAKNALAGVRLPRKKD